VPIVDAFDPFDGVSQNSLSDVRGHAQAATCSAKIMNTPIGERDLLVQSPFGSRKVIEVSVASACEHVGVAKLPAVFGPG